MNEFTKEELELMARELSPWGNDYAGMQEEREDLLNKIQSMIDDYSECEHERDGGCHLLTDKATKKVHEIVFKCKKCGEFYR